MFYYVYILRSKRTPKETYIGFSENLKERIEEHNNGEVKSTKRYLPWKLESYIAFRNEYKALHFEKYLKVGSGKAFLNKRLL
ncbi:excinuclease ABC subunit C [candidate division WWE3 bacterium CG10_big_fil_rev_8_21_14_0_10_32_10]|uniref:Excinuclease ABC subunit C n=1 Tax=candidate division WWE3 bacterium CG10_big_fil_rev_8_21_14_0_10_32_10 TaxID=1975090 RepID=A0A2H0RA37_UNCKA|nr:MAG: excinuclease ABC subunit C [candidate division WWE3 bacterium CG10_big_fil_rev_8_21_14_0_10_32_10]